MKKQFLSLVVLGFYAQIGWAQQSNETLLKEWLRANPEVKLVSQAQYQAMSATDRAVLDAMPNKLVYAGSTLSWSDVQSYNPNQPLRSFDELQAEYLQAEQTQKMQAEAHHLQIKNWVAQHPEVKIVSMQTLQQCNPQTRAAILSAPHLIVHSGELKWEDIQAYEGAN